MKRLDPYQEEHAADVSALSHVCLLSDFDLCSSEIESGGKKNYSALIYVQTMCGRAGDLHRTYSRQLKETPGAACPAVLGVCPLPGFGGV